MSAGGFGSRWEITYQEIDFGPERLEPPLRAVFRNGKFLAPARLSSDRSFDKGYSQSGILCSRLP